VKLEGDFRQIDIAAAPSCDVYDAGAPCQFFSVAEREAGLDLRGNLMFEQLSYLPASTSHCLEYSSWCRTLRSLSKGSYSDLFWGSSKVPDTLPTTRCVRGQALRCVPAPRAASGSGSQV
jgi:hypothetical protein